MPDFEVAGMVAPDERIAEAFNDYCRTYPQAGWRKPRRTASRRYERL
jgi:hypothetical protein